MKDEAPTEGFPRQVPLFPFLVLALSLLFTCLVTYYLSSANRVKNAVRFANATLVTDAAINDSLNTYTALLRGGAGLLAASPSMTKDDFEAYFSRLRVSEFYPGLFGFGFAKRTRPGEQAALKEEMRRTGRTNFTIWPESSNEESFPVVFIEPMNWRNQRALGYDMYSEPVRHEAMEKAARRGFALSGKVTLVQETDENPQAGFLMYVGVYAKGIFPETDAERKEKLIGFVYSPFRADDLFAGIFAGSRKLLTSLEVYDGNTIAPEHLLFRSSHAIPRKSLFKLNDKLYLGGHTWTLVHRTTPEFERSLEHANVYWVFASGLALSFILFGVTFFLAKARQRAEESEQRLRQKRERLQASEELHRTIAETAADAIITIDSHSKIITINRAAERIFGYKIEELVGQNLTMLMPERMRSQHEAGIARYIATGKKGIPWGGVELPGLHKDGREIPLEISFGEMRKSGNRTFTGIIRDITERKKAEEQIRNLNRDLENRVRERTAELLEANNQMETFVYSIAHDLRAPLRAMRGFAQALREDYAMQLDDQARDYSARIIASAKFMDDLINDLLSFSRITRAELTLSPISLDAVLLQIRQQLADDIAEKEATIDVPAKLPDVIAHEATVRQVMTNLLSNSLKFVSKSVRPHIVIRAEDAGANWRVWVEDNGIGISPEYRDRIFGIFERLHGGAYAGTGIGLAIVRKGIERMNGQVGFESELDKGSRFWFELPKA